VIAGLRAVLAGVFGILGGFISRVVSWGTGIFLLINFLILPIYWIWGAIVGWNVEHSGGDATDAAAHRGYIGTLIIAFHTWVYQTLVPIHFGWTDRLHIWSTPTQGRMTFTSDYFGFLFTYWLDLVWLMLVIGIVAGIVLTVLNFIPSISGLVAGGGPGTAGGSAASTTGSSTSVAVGSNHYGRAVGILVTAVVVVGGAFLLGYYVLPMSSSAILQVIRDTQKVHATDARMQAYIDQYAGLGHFDPADTDKIADAVGLVEGANDKTSGQAAQLVQLLSQTCNYMTLQDAKKYQVSIKVIASASIPCYQDPAAPALVAKDSSATLSPGDQIGLVGGRLLLLVQIVTLVTLVGLLWFFVNGSLHRYPASTRYGMIALGAVLLGITWYILLPLPGYVFILVAVGAIYLGIRLVK
jgi:hypothetical protein